MTSMMARGSSKLPLLLLARVSSFSIRRDFYIMVALSKARETDTEKCIGIQEVRKKILMDPKIKKKMMNSI